VLEKAPEHSVVVEDVLKNSGELDLVDTAMGYSVGVDSVVVTDTIDYLHFRVLACNVLAGDVLACIVFAMDVFAMDVFAMDVFAMDVFAMDVLVSDVLVSDAVAWDA